MKARLPKLWGVLYADPNTNGERKSCSNCMFTDEAAQDCQVVDAPISPEMICGYHVERGHLTDPDLAGLETVPGGTSCSTCRYFSQGPTASLAARKALGQDQPDNSEGTCAAVEGDDDQPATVSPMGCCGRWESGEG